MTVLSEEHKDSDVSHSLQDAVERDRLLAAENPLHVPRLVGDLLALAENEHTNHETAAGVVALREAVSLLRELSAKDASRFEAQFARCALTLAHRLHSAGDKEGGVDALQEAVSVFRHLSATDPAEFEPYLARSLLFLANRQHTELKQKLAVITEAVSIFRRLAYTEPNTFTLDLSRGLIALATTERFLGHPESAASAAEEATEILRSCAKADLNQVGSDLARCLRLNALLLMQNGQRKLAIERFEEGVDTMEKWAAYQPAQRRQDLVDFLKSVSNMYSELNQIKLHKRLDRELQNILSKRPSARGSKFRPWGGFRWRA